jgi:hypothetical protein
MGSTARRRGVYGGEYAPTGPVCVVEEKWRKEASETGQRLRRELVTKTVDALVLL